jgi:uncharacterized protein
MNTQEREQLNQLLKQLAAFKLTNKDSEAEALIQQAALQQPDALYLLTQRTLLLEQALNNAKARIDQLQRQAQVGQASGSFLGADPWAQPVAGAGVPGAANYQPNRYAPPVAPAPSAAPAQAGGGLFGGGSFLGNIAATAAGVAAGGFLFQGIENLMGHHHGMGGFDASGFDQTGFGEHVSEQTVINNYYGDDAGQLGADDSFRTAGFDNGAAFDNAGFDNAGFGGGDFVDDDADTDSDWI